jgi:hypothetical protein
MTDGLTFFYNVFPIYQYHIIPAILSAIIFFSLLFSKQRKNLIIIILQVATIFSITLSTEYLLIFLFFGSLPEAIGFFEKFVLCVGIVITLLFVVRESSKGTWFGDRISELLKKFSNFEEEVIPFGLFSEQLKKLHSLKDQIQNGNSDQISSAYYEFTHIGTSIVTFLQSNPMNDCVGINRYEESKQLFDECEVCFKQISLPENLFNEILKTKTSIAISKFIGFVEGLNFINSDEKCRKD